MEKQKLSVSDTEDPTNKRGTNLYKQAAEKNRKSRKESNTINSYQYKPTLRKDKSASKEKKYVEIESVPKVYLVERLPLAHKTTEEYIKEERKLNQYDSDEEFENFKDNNYVASSESYFSKVLLNTSKFAILLGAITTLQYLYYMFWYGNFQVIYFWIGLIYSVFSIYTYYQINRFLDDLNHRFCILMYDLNAIVLCALSIVLAWSFDAMMIQADEANLMLIKENRLYLMIPIYAGLPLNMLNYYINSVLGVYYTFQHKLANE